MTTDHRAALANIRTFPQLLAYLRDEMGWPMDRIEVVDDLMFDYTAEELGIDAKNAPKIEEIKRLRPLSANQPWGIFFIKFAPKRLPVVALRRILGQVVLKKRAKKSEDRSWSAGDLLFISNYGEGESRQISFAHFSQSEDKRDLPTLKVLGWDNLDTPLHLDAVAKELTEHLSWPEDDEDVEAWREQWRSAFTLKHGQVITTSKQLSVALAELARSIRDRIKTALAIETQNGRFTKLMKAFQDALIHDLDSDGFADMYAQTIAYGLLSARIADPHKKTTDDFAGHMRTNPFLRELMETFLQIGGRQCKAGGPGIDFDELGVSDVVELLDDANMEAVVDDFGDRNRQEDPVVHFYELFLTAYNKQLKIHRGVFYTPQPVVSYIVRSVHELLQTEFGLADGLADTTTWGEMLQTHPGMSLPPLTDDFGENRTISRDEPFVQILDPATGTATFLVEVIEVIHRTLTAKWTQQRLSLVQQRDAWNEYVPQRLLPRLHAFELMMAPYAIAHMKLGLKLAETGYRFETAERARIYLTNALEPSQEQLQLPDFDALAHEAAAVNEIKRHKRFTVVIGNPPYAGISSNMTKDAQRIVDAYKVVDGSTLMERKLWLQDDYVKFIRKAQTTIECTGVGCFGFITNNGYLGNPTFRGMRQSLMRTFPLLQLLDLHGNANKKEQAPDGSEDKNVFDIRQGVGICLATRGGRRSTWGHADSWGPREAKYARLTKHTVGDTDFSVLRPDSPYYFFTPQNIDSRAEYDGGWRINEAIPVNSAGFITARDHFVTDFDAGALLSRIAAFANPKVPDDEIRATYFAGHGSDKYPEGDTRGWKLPSARHRVQSDPKWRERIVRCLYRPFDFRSVYWADWMVDWPRPEVMGHMFGGDNRALLTARSNKTSGTDHFFCAAIISETKCAEYSTQSAVFPLYTFHSASTARGWLALGTERQPNFDRRFLQEMAAALSLPQTKPHGLPRGLTPEDIFHYAYAVFHSPGYRNRYAEFLKIDFPRLPLTGNLELFHALARLGGELTALHLLESPRLDQPVTEFNGGHNPEVEKVSWSKKTVWVDKSQTVGFKGVPEAVWNFHIGGYQVCEKWLKDRKGRTLSDDDIAHYQKIMVAISETIRLMKEIDEVIEDHGGWPGAFQTGEVEASAEVLPFRIVAQPAASDRYVTCLRLVPLKVAAGQFGDPQHVVNDEWEWVKVNTKHRLREGMFVAQVVGRSMEPQIADGDWCLFAHPAPGTREGKTVLVQLRDATDPDTGERYTVKRYESEKVEIEDSWRHVRITLKPLNPDFEPIVFTGDDEGVLQVVAEFLEVLTTPPIDSSLHEPNEEPAPPKPPAKKRTSDDSSAQQSLLGLVAESPSAEAQKRTDAGQLDRAPAKPAAEDSHPASRRDLVDQFEVEDVLAIIRDVVTTADPMPREDAIRAIATQLGAERVGARIRDFIDGMLNTASRRLIIETRDGGLVACTRSIDDYHRDFLKTVLKAVIGHTWTDEDDAIRAATRHLGFRRTGPKISKAFKSAINGLLRQNELERDGRALRRAIQ
jgi:Predicted helicase